MAAVPFYVLFWHSWNEREPTGEYSWTSLYEWCKKLTHQVIMIEGTYLVLAAISTTYVAVKGKVANPGAYVLRFTCLLRVLLLPILFVYPVLYWLLDAGPISKIRVMDVLKNETHGPLVLVPIVLDLCITKMPHFEADVFMVWIYYWFYVSLVVLNHCIGAPPMYKIMDLHNLKIALPILAVVAVVLPAVHGVLRYFLAYRDIIFAEKFDETRALNEEGKP